MNKFIGSAIVVLSFILFTIGMDGFSTKVVDGRYWLPSHGVDVEVSRVRYLVSWYVGVISVPLYGVVVFSLLIHGIVRFITKIENR